MTKNIVRNFIGYSVLSFPFLIMAGLEYINNGLEGLYYFIGALAILILCLSLGFKMIKV